MDREVCYVYAYYNQDLENTVSSDLVYHDYVDEYLRVINKRYGGRYDRNRLISVVNRNKNHMVNEENICDIKDFSNKKEI